MIFLWKFSKAFLKREMIIFSKLRAKNQNPVQLTKNFFDLTLNSTTHESEIRFFKFCTKLKNLKNFKKMNLKTFGFKTNELILSSKKRKKK